VLCTESDKLRGDLQELHLHKSSSLKLKQTDEMADGDTESPAVG